MHMTNITLSAHNLLENKKERKDFFLKEFIQSLPIVDRLHILQW